MSRLDELRRMRDFLDAEIETESALETARSERMGQLRLRFAVLTRGTYATRVCTAVAQHFGVTLDVLLGESRDALASSARQVAMFLMRESGMGPVAIGRELERDHATVLHGCRRVASDERLSHVAALISSALAEASSDRVVA